MLNFFLFLSIVLSSQTSFAQTFNLGRFSIAESRIQLELNDFLIRAQNPDIVAAWVPDSLQWIRNENNLLVPRALLKILIKKEEAQIDYQKKIILPVKKDRFVSSEIYIDLFNPDIISIYAEEELIEKISIEAHSKKTTNSKQLIDYSCSPYELKIEGIDDEYLSVGCKMNRLGKMWNERPLLEVTMSSTNLRTMHGTKPPYTIYLEDNSPVEMKLKGTDQKINTLQLSAFVPEKLHRLKTSFGFGPYVYQSQQNGASQNANLAPSLMLYGKYDLTETASFKAFDALLYSKTFFNNSGLYFSYDLAQALDGRILINALLGFQGLHYKYSKDTSTVFRLIYPQGFEVIYKHAFFENYNLTYGMFLSTSSESYTNTWLRYGKSTFLELNYIHWGFEKSEIKMWGISIGIPFFSVF